MKKFFLLGVLCAIPLLAADPLIGTWKFNPHKSRVEDLSNFKNRRQVFEALGPNSYRFTETGEGPDGKEQKIVETLVFDGKEYTRSDGSTATFERIDDYRVKVSRKQNGRSQTADVTISDDGKTLTLI
jgi:hypothetical protein